MQHQGEEEEDSWVAVRMSEARARWEREEREARARLEASERELRERERRLEELRVRTPQEEAEVSKHHSF